MFEEEGSSDRSQFPIGGIVKRVGGFVVLRADPLVFFCRAWTMVKIKEKTGERLLWVRTIGSSIFGYIIDTTLFVCIAFIGTVPTYDIFTMIGIQIVVKLLIEALGGTPLAYVAIRFLKKRI